MIVAVSYPDGGYTPPADNERVVVQYGPEWMAHVMSGGDVRNGNVLIDD